VILLTAEDDIEDTIIPRLKAAGADMDRVHIIGMAKRYNAKARTFEEGMFDLTVDIAALRRKIEEIGEVVQIIIDPLTSYVGVGKINSASTTDIRGMLAPLILLAAAARCSVIGIMHFNKKADVTNAMLRIADSLAYVAAARHVYVVVPDPEQPGRRIFVKAKNNLAPDTGALTYTIDARHVGHDDELDVDIKAPYVVWGSDHVKVTATEAMQAAADAAGNERQERRAAKEFLQGRLAAGPVLQSEIQEEAEANGIAKRTLDRAKRDLKIKPWKEKKPGGKWYWQLPAEVVGVL
jgi:putative DNA primase/helicase